MTPDAPRGGPALLAVEEWVALPDAASDPERADHRPPPAPRRRLRDWLTALAATWTG